MKPGRRPKPTSLRLLQGNPGKRPLNLNEPRPKSRTRTPPAPSGLGPDGQREWKRLAKELVSQGLLTNLDLTALRLYCDAFETYTDAIRNIRELGTTVESPNDYLMTSPHVHLANKAHDQMIRLMREFGLTPSSRSGLNIPLADPMDETEAFLFGNLRPPLPERGDQNDK